MASNRKGSTKKVASKKAAKVASKRSEPASAKAPMLLDFNDPAAVRARLHGYDSVEQARAETALFDFSSEYWQIEDDFD